MNGQVRPTEASDHPTTRPRPNRGHDVHLHHPPGRPPRMMALIGLCDRARSTGCDDGSLGGLASALRGHRPSPRVCHSRVRLKRPGSAASAQLLVRLLGPQPLCCHARKCRLVPSGRAGSGSAVTACPAGVVAVRLVRLHRVCMADRREPTPIGAPRGAIGSGSSSPMIVVGLVIESCCPSASALPPPMLVEVTS